MKLSLNQTGDAPWWFWGFFAISALFSLAMGAGGLWLGYLLIQALQRYLAGG